MFFLKSTLVCCVELQGCEHLRHFAVFYLLLWRLLDTPENTGLLVFHINKWAQKHEGSLLGNEKHLHWKGKDTRCERHVSNSDCVLFTPTLWEHLTCRPSANGKEEGGAWYASKSHYSGFFLHCTSGNTEIIHYLIICKIQQLSLSDRSFLLANVVSSENDSFVLQRKKSLILEFTL